MSTNTLYRLSGGGLFLGALLAALGYLMKPVVGHDLSLYFNPLYQPSSLMTFSGAILMLLCLPGMYAYQASSAGKFGLASFIIAYLGLIVLEVGMGLLYAFVPPLLASNPATSFLISQPRGGGFEGQLGSAFLVFFLIGLLGSNLGGLLYGIATFRARVYPRWAAMLTFGGVILGFLLSLLNSPLIGDRPIILMLAGFAWCGLSLWTRQDTVPAPSSAAIYPPLETKATH